MKNYIVNAVVALLLIIGVGIFSQKGVPQQSDVLGGLSERDIQAVSLKVGQNGNKISNLKTGFCYLAPTVPTIAASTTATVACQATLGWNASGTYGITRLLGIVSGDPVIANLTSTTAGSLFGGIDIVGASASTTAGYIELKVANNTGATYTYPVSSGVASGTAAYISTH